MSIGPSNPAVLTPTAPPLVERVFDGLELLMRAVGASKGVLGIKRKHEEIIPRLKEIAKSRRNISILEMGDYYPAGDEQCLVYEATGRIVIVPTPIGNLGDMTDRASLAAAVDGVERVVHESGAHLSPPPRAG